MSWKKIAVETYVDTFAMETGSGVTMRLDSHDADGALVAVSTTFIPNVRLVPGAEERHIIVPLG